MFSKWMILLLATMVMSELTGDAAIRRKSYEVGVVSCAFHFLIFHLLLHVHKDSTQQGTHTTNARSSQAARILWQDRVHGRFVVSSNYSRSTVEIEMLSLMAFIIAAIQRNEKHFQSAQGHSE